MSGSSGPVTGGPAGEHPCASLRLARPLEAPVPGVADALTVGDILRLELQAGPPEVVAAVTATGVLAGAVAPTMRLLECLHQDVAFEAEVRSANHGAVQLEVRAVP
jgi:hypothetical protein